jgi:hypothetical protein
MIRIEHNVETGEIKEIELTPEEIKDIEEKRKKAEARNVKLEIEQAAKAAARQEILDRLGLTADEAALLLGAN